MSKDKAEEKSYLQDLFNHMSSEYGLILTQSEMLEILSICGKEYDNVQFELGEIERQHTDLSTENAQLREALREIVKHTDDMMNARTDLEYNLSSVNRTNAIEQAKQLLTETQK